MIVQLTDIAPDRGPIDRVTVPYDRVDEAIQTSKGSPCHVQASPGIPGYDSK